MSKHFYLIALLLVAAQSILTADVHDYKPQGTIPLIDDITNLGYSPDQKHLIMLAGSLANDTFAHYYGYRLNQKQLVKIVDDGIANIQPSAFAFSKNGDWLAVGTSWGAVYGYQIVEGEIKSGYKYKKRIGTGQPEEGVKSISFSAGGQIAVAAKELLVVLTEPNDEQATDYDMKVHNCRTILTSVAWRHNNEDIVIVGGDRQPAFFHIVDVTKDPITPVQIQVTPTPSQTLSIGVFPDAAETILQGRFNENIEIYQWDDGLKNYKSFGPIPDAATVKASQISITNDGLYFGAEISSQGKVLAWKSGLQLNPANNLKNQAPQAITPNNILIATGKNLALSNDGNRILIIGATSTADKYSICDADQWYDNGARDCKPCENGCGQCFNPTDCNTCPDNKTYIDPQNHCIDCSTIGNGCQQCSDSATCTGCNTTRHFDPTPDPTCKCAKTYFPDNNQCTTCNNGTNFCSECDSPSKCTLCIDAEHIQKLPVNGTCVCEAGWYLDGTCKDCTAQTGCKECQSGSNCTLCDHASNWAEDPSGKCICAPGYWQNGTECMSCNSKTPNCTACQQDGTCTKCIDTREVSPDKTQCICEGHTYEDTTTQKCEFCDLKLKCLHCDPTGDHTCTQCDYIDGHRKKQPVDGNCYCQPGFTENDQEVCTQCFVDGCQQCATLDVCSQCFAEKNFKPDPVDKTCVCVDGYLKKKDKQSCSTCGKQIPGCAQCQDLEVCQACNSENHFIPTPNTDNKCSCAATYFLNDTLCQLCSAEYKNCEECDMTHCTKCQAGYLATDDNKKCLTCGEAIPGCKSCTDLKSCTECNAEKQWQLASDNKTCSCKLGYYKNGTECKFCLMQYPYCTNCSMQSGCFSCQQTFSYNSDLKVCFCPDDKQVKEGKCEDKSGLSALAIIAIVVGILAVAGAAVAIIKCFKKRQSPLEDGEYEALEGEKN